MQITGKTKLLGIIGNPIEHSMSPLIQNKAFEALNLDYVYIPVRVVTKDLSTVLDGFKAINLRGFNVTIPHKQNVIPLLDRVTDTAKAIGAVNTVWLTEEGWHGTNTDIDGFIAPLRELDRDWSKIKPIVLGNGGASRAVVVGCSQLGCTEIQVVGRNRTKLETFARSWEPTNLSAKITIHHWDELDELIEESKLIVNTTPIGMYPHIDASPFTREQSESIAVNTIVYDLIYTPRPTLFLQQAQQKQAITIDGSQMLVEQGAVGFKIWTGKSAPTQIMLANLLSVFDDRLKEN